MLRIARSGGLRRARGGRGSGLSDTPQDRRGGGVVAAKWGAAPCRSRAYRRSRRSRPPGRAGSDFTRALRTGDDPVLARIESGKILLDVRTVPGRDPGWSRQCIGSSTKMSAAVETYPGLLRSRGLHPVNLPLLGTACVRPIHRRRLAALSTSPGILLRASCADGGRRSGARSARCSSRSSPKFQVLPCPASRSRANGAAACASR